MDRERREWHGRAVEEWRRAWGVPTLRVYESVGSTNDIARGMAEDGAEQGSTVVADEQTRGRGRRGRVWRSDPGQSLILSMVARPRSLEAESVLSIRLGLAVARAIEEIAPVAVGLKWPNDLMIDGLKVGGMLCEGAVEGERPAYVVAGTGVNVLQPDDAWTGALAGRATSLAARHGAAVSIPRLAGRVVQEWLRVLDRREGRLDPVELDAFRARDVLRGRRVTVDAEKRGVARGVEPDGALRLAGDEGRSTRVVSGTVRVVEPDAGESI
ncbi:MAG: biotin--[acetyl-CoA-carboxylase] ligase [Longimicrobiales bacterium]|nr:biotin--[acetyl-CoA-carboxylase] ligase [Longimicrobiales bacterium]